MSAAARELARPEAAAAVADLVLAVAHARAAADRGRDRRRSPAGAAGDRPTAAPFDAARHRDRHPAPARRQDRRATSSLARYTTMRVGGPADLFAVAHNAFELRGLVRFARARAIPFLDPRAGAATSSIADAGFRGLVIQARAEGSRVDGDRYHADAGVPMARAATETQKAGLTGPRVRARDPGHGRRRGLGQRRRARRGDRARPRVRDASCSPTAPRSCCRPRELGFALPPQPVQGREPAPAGGPAEIVLRAVFRLAPGRPDGDQGAPRRASAAGAASTSRWASRRRGRCSATRTATRPGRLIDDARASRATVSAAPSCPRSTPTSSSTTRAGPPPTSAGSPSTSAREVRARHGVELAFEVEFVGRLVRLATRGDRLMPVPPLAHDPAATPVAVVLGGPSAEHDVSIVSGSAIADALAASGYPVETWLIDLDGGWWRLPDGFRRDGRPQAAYDDPAALGAAGPQPRRPGPRRRSPGASRPAASCSSRSTARSARTARPRRCARRRASPTRAPGVTASAVGMDKALFKRLARGLGLPVADWVEVRAAALGRATATPSSAELEAFAAGGGDPRLMVKPVGPRQLGRDDPGPRRRRSAAAALDEAFRYDDVALAERYLAGRPRPRGLGAGQRARPSSSCTGRARSCPGHEFYDYAGEVHAGPVARPRPTAEVTPRPAGDDPQARARHVPRDRRRGLRPDRLPARRRGRSSCPRSTRSRASRRSACSRPCAPRAATTSPPSAGGSSTSRSRATAPGSRHRLTAADLPR